MEKKCTKCGVVKSLDEFGNDKSKKDGKQSRCKSCCKESREELKRYKTNNMSTLEFIKLFNDNHALKKCTKCKEVKSLDQFTKDKNQKDKKDQTCKVCKKLYSFNNKKKAKEYRNKNKETAKEYYKEYYKKNKEKIKQHRIKNKERIKEYNKEYNKKNKEKNNKISRIYYQKNKERLIEYSKKYRLNNTKKRNTYLKEYTKLRKQKDPLFKLNRLIRMNIYCSLKRQGYTKKTKSYNILKCEYNFFMTWLNGIASNGYTYGIGDLQLDHVIPISLGQTEDELYLLNHYSNFQLLSADENLAKSNRYVNPTNLKRVLEHHPSPDKIREIHARL